MKTAITTLAILAFTIPTFADTFVVTANSTSWSPDVVNVVPGDIIRFEYGTGYPHTITSGSGCTYDGVYFNHDLSAPGDYYEFEITEDLPDEIPFYCDPHCKMGMTGVIMIDHPSGHMVIGVVDISNPDTMQYYLDDLSDTATLSVECDGSLGSTFAIGVEIEEANVDIAIEVTGVGASAYMLQVSTGVDTLLTTGTYTLDAMELYLFHGETAGKQHINFALSWPETGSEDDVNISSVQLEGQGSINSSGDSFAIYAANSDSIGRVTIESLADGEIFLGLIGDVTCTTLTLPASGEEATITLPTGIHIISVSGLGMLWFPLSGGGDGGSGMAEDVTGDGVVDVSDLLAVISAWGATAP